MKSFTQALAGALLVSTLTGCASHVANWENINTQSANEAAVTDQSPAKMIQRAQMKVNLAKSEELAFFAPRHLISAEQSLMEAKEMHTGGEPQGEVKVVAALSIRTVDAGLQTKRQVNKTLYDALAHRDVLFEIKANQFFPTDFEALEVHLKELIDLIESGKVMEAQKGDKELRKNMRILEVKTIEYQQLETIKKQLADIEARGGADVAPYSWKTAQDMLKRAQATIELDPRAVSKIKLATLNAKRSADHADVITDISNKIANAGSGEAEDIALEFEKQLYRISVALKHEDIRHKDFAEQAAKYSANIEDLMRKTR